MKSNSLSKLLLISFIAVAACVSDEEVIAPAKSPTVQMKSADTLPPFDFLGLDVSFYGNLSYGNSELNALDLFVPNTDEPHPVLICIHGGGFIAGDKSDFYQSNQEKAVILYLLSRGVAVANVNYRLIKRSDDQGLSKPLTDVKTALQYVKYHASTYGIDSSRVVLFGESAGAGCALWLAYNDNLANALSANPIAQQSTRVDGVLAVNAQATYNFVLWPSVIFQPFIADGFDYDLLIDVIGLQSLMGYYGLVDPSELTANNVLAVASSYDLLDLISSDDPEVYIDNSDVPGGFPENLQSLYHHPLHVQALQERAADVGAVGKYYAPQIVIDTREGESMIAFIERKLDI